MIAWRTSTSGVLVPTYYRAPTPAKPAAPCPDAIRQRLRELRAEFASRAARK